ncbi:hypothetical protein GCM10027037_08740 [Mucilaginibacter koreensis]
MKHFNKKYLIILLSALSVLASCKKDKNNPESVKTAAERKGLYVLNQGNFGSSNSTLTYYNYGTQTLTADFFAPVNGRVLGGVGNDVQIYGSKMYVVMNTSNTLEVLNPQTGKSIKQIYFTSTGTATGQGRQPRYVVFNKNKAFISSYDGTVAVLDTASLNIDKFINVGRNPEHMAVANNKLYVANSGGLSYATGNYDNTVSVIDLNSLTETKKITVVINPNGLVADKNGNIYVQSTGNYGSVPNSLTIIDYNTDQVKSSAAFDGGSLFVQGDNLYCITGDKKIKMINTKTQAVAHNNFITDGTVISTPYFVSVDGVTGEVFVTDAKDYASNGSITAFDKNGKKEYTLTTGISPGSVAFLY